mgnify:FL=1
MKLSIPKKILLFSLGFFSYIGIIVILVALQFTIDADNFAMMIVMHLISFVAAYLIVFLPVRKYFKFEPADTKITFILFLMGFIIPSVIAWNFMANFSLF